MEKEYITVKIEAHISGSDSPLHDYRELRVEGTRGDVSKKLDDFCEELEASFNH